MKATQKIAVAVAVAAAAQWNIAEAAATLRYAPDYASCARNCGQITQVGNLLVVTLMDKSGKAFKMLSAGIPSSATKAVVSAANESQSAPAFFGTAPVAGEITANAHTAVIDTATETIIYTVIYYYQSAQLVDAKMMENRFSHIEK